MLKNIFNAIISLLYLNKGLNLKANTPYTISPWPIRLQRSPVYCYTSRLLLVFILLGTAWQGNAQEKIYQTFKDTRVINAHSVETLPKRKLDVRISHRFGDLAGDNGGYKTFFGMENAEDILFGVEYGVSDNLMFGLHRTKGAGSMPNGDSGLRQLLNGVVKLRFLQQTTDNKVPVSMALVGIASLSTAEKIEDNPDIIRSFPKFAHRMATNVELVIARKFSDRFSIQLIPGFTQRNLVPFEDENGIFSLGASARIQLTKVMAFLTDATFPFSERRKAVNGFYTPLAFGLEFDTGGHVFQFNLTNTTALMETDYIPYTTSNWGEGQFRLGFTISRLFNL